MASLLWWICLVQLLIPQSTDPGPSCPEPSTNVFKTALVFQMCRCYNAWSFIDFIYWFDDKAAWNVIFMLFIIMKKISFSFRITQKNATQKTVYFRVYFAQFNCHAQSVQLRRRVSCLTLSDGWKAWLAIKSRVGLSLCLTLIYLIA